MYLVGQKLNKEIIDNGKLDRANFIIIKGPKNYGKTYLAKYIADHFKMTYMLLDNKVSTIRDLVESSVYDNNCVYQFKDFEKSSPAAKAALLKITEETPDKVKIIITTSGYNLLDTLISRAYLINIESYNEDDINTFNEVLNLDKDQFNRIKDNLRIHLTPSLLCKYKEREDIGEIIDLVLECKELILNQLKLEDISLISNKFWNDDEEKLIIFLDMLKNSIPIDFIDFSYIIKAIEKTLYIINTISVNNYKQLIHNMLMEMII